MRPQILTHKIALSQPIGESTDNHRLRGCQPLELGGNVGRFAQGKSLASVPTTHLPHDDQTGMNTYPHRQPYTPLVLQAGVQQAAGLNKAQACTDGALGIVFVRLGITIVDQQTVPEVLRNIAVEALDDLRTRRLVGTDDLAVVFGVELSGK